MQISIRIQDIRNQFKKLIETYQDIIDDCTDLNINNSTLNWELDLLYIWCTTLLLVEFEKTNAFDLYFNINPNVFPIISKLLQIVKTLPVSTAMGERSIL